MPTNTTETAEDETGIGQIGLLAAGAAATITAGYLASKMLESLFVPPQADEPSVSGIPTEADIKDQITNLSTADRAVFRTIQLMLTEHLGSSAAARLWLTSPGDGFENTPLDLILRGQAKQLLAVLEAQWGPNPAYA